MTAAELRGLRIAAYVVVGLIVGVALLWSLALGIQWGAELFPQRLGPPACELGTYNVYPGSPNPRCVPNGQVDP